MTITRIISLLSSKNGYSLIWQKLLQRLVPYQNKVARARLLASDSLRAVNLLPPSVPSTKNYNLEAARGRTIRLLSDAVVNPDQRALAKGLSVLTLNLNGAKFLPDYLEGLKQLPRVPTELVFIDHNSKDESVNLVKRFASSSEIDIKVVRKTENDTFSKSNNEALGHAKFENILLLNNDVVITENSKISEALSVLDADDRIGVVGWNLFHDSDQKYSQHEGISFVWDHVRSFFRPTNIANSKSAHTPAFVRQFAAVTAAMALCRKKDILAIGGFDESYNYGYEDVDLCLSMSHLLGLKSVMIDTLSAIHSENRTQREDRRLAVRNRRQGNQTHFIEKFGFALRVLNRRRLLDRYNPYNLKKITIGFVVTEAFEQATAGDYFTALEFSRAIMKEFDYDIKFFPQRGKGAVSDVDCSGVEVLVVLIDRFDLSKLQNRSSNTLLVAWMRNWFDRWASWSYFHDYDFYFVSSETARNYLFSEHGVTSHLLKIGTNFESFFRSPSSSQRDLDVSFVGSKWGVTREIESVFPRLARYKAKVFGHGWESDGDEKELFGGPIDYRRVPSVYAMTKIVLDDAAGSTKHWGSMNSRVYDAIASGCLVITNANQFGERDDSNINSFLDIPSYSSGEELEHVLNKYLNDEELRVKECHKLQSQVRDFHSYSARAKEFHTTLSHSLSSSFRIAIKVPAPNEQEKHKWGDYHFADSLKLALKALGHFVRIDLLEDWYSGESAGDDVVLVLRGLSEYKVNSDQINLMWNISHPDKVEDREYETYDTVFVASEIHAKTLYARLHKTKVLPLLQCTDPRRFYKDLEGGEAENEVLFVGNSRRIYRDVVKFSIEADISLSVYGGLWEDLIPQHFIKGQNVPNVQLRKYYSSAKVVLNDHWETMRNQGFISNRLFDVVACGGVVVSDYVPGMEDIFKDSVITFDGTSKGFIEALEKAQEVRSSDENADNIAKHHSFDARAAVLISEIARLSEIRCRGL
ncbi:MAG: GT2 family glycosyltransferase/spore maturation protein CgeB [Cryomorphaceae bacterium]|jgi:GT2 family glycosyltransferase/spore maturation protein CgeB